MARRTSRSHRYRHGSEPASDRARENFDKLHADAIRLGDDEMIADLEDIGRQAGYFEPPSETEVINATIRVQAGRGTQADRDVLRALEHAHGGGKGNRRLPAFP